MSLAPCPPASPRPLSPSFHHRMLDQIDDRRRQSSVSTSLASPGYSCALVGDACNDRQRITLSRRTSMTGVTRRTSPPQEELFQQRGNTFYPASYVQQCPRSPTRRQSQAPVPYNHQPPVTSSYGHQQPPVTWVSRQSSEPEPDHQHQNINSLSPRPLGGSQKQRSSRRRRQKPAPLNLRGRGYDAEDDSSATASPENSPRTPRNLNPGMNSSPRGSPKSPRSPRNLTLNAGGGSVRYFATTPLSPIPPSPLPTSANSQQAFPRPHSPVSPTWQQHSRPTSPRPSSSSGHYRPQSPIMGNLARLASRRRSNAVGYRRTSNFLELPVSDYEKQRRFCSLPEKGYNPRQLANEFYRLRAFSITPNGALIKHGDQIARRSRSSAGSTANNSRNHSRAASRCGSRDGSPRRRSPIHFMPVSPSQKSMNSNYDFEEIENSISHDEQVNDSDDIDDSVESPIKFRVCILGHTGTGKTSLVNQFLTSEYMNAYDTSLDDEFGERSVSVSLDGVESEIVFIDHTSGEMSVENTLSTYEPHACIVIYSVTDQISFNSAEEIIGYLCRFGYTSANSVILVANKIDLERSRMISTEEGRRLATSCEVKFIETSACIQHNVDELLVGILKQMRLRHERRESGEKCGKNTGSRNSRSSFCQGRRVSSPLHTLQVARDILSRVCISSKSSSKSCENLHVL